MVSKWKYSRNQWCIEMAWSSFFSSQKVSLLWSKFRKISFLISLLNHWQLPWSCIERIQHNVGTIQNTLWPNCIPHSYLSVEGYCLILHGKSGCSLLTPVVDPVHHLKGLGGFFNFWNWKAFFFVHPPNNFSNVGGGGIQKFSRLMAFFFVKSKHSKKNAIFHFSFHFVGCKISKYVCYLRLEVFWVHFRSLISIIFVQ